MTSKCLILFKFEKSYFDKEQISSQFVGHPLLDEQLDDKIDINQFVGKNKALMSIFSGSRISEINLLMPILINFIKLMQEKYKDITYVFHSTKEHNELTQSFIKSSGLNNCEVISDDKLKTHLLKSTNLNTTSN